MFLQRSNLLFTVKLFYFCFVCYLPFCFLIVFSSFFQNCLYICCCHVLLFFIYKLKLFLFMYAGKHFLKVQSLIKIYFCLPFVIICILLNFKLEKYLYCRYKLYNFFRNVINFCKLGAYFTLMSFEVIKIVVLNRIGFAEMGKVKYKEKATSTKGRLSSG